MGNDTDRLQQMEDNWNNRDSVYNKLGKIQTTTRKALKEDPLDKLIRVSKEAGQMEVLCELQEYINKKRKELK